VTPKPARRHGIGLADSIARRETWRRGLMLWLSWGLTRLGRVLCLAIVG